MKRSFELIAADITGPDCWPHLLDGIDAVVHLAGLVNDPSCYARNSLQQSTDSKSSKRKFSKPGDEDSCQQDAAV